MRKLNITLLFFCSLLTTYGQNIAGYEYWFDYGYENRVKTSSNNGNINLSLDVSQLSEGIHFYNFRAKDSNGNWSAPLTQYFFRSSTQQINNQIACYEYWIDKNYASRKKVTGSNSIINLELDVVALSKGIHYFNFRSQDAKGNWSAPITQYFYKPEIVNADNKIVTYEYWIDRDFDNRQSVTSSNGIINLNVDLAAFKKGIHYFNFRAKDSNDKWSTPVTQYFYIPERIISDNKIVAYEYWCNDAYDSKIKVDLEQPVNPFEIQNQLLTVNNLLATATPNSFEFEVNVNGNATIYYSGSNRFNIRFLDTNNNWTSTSVNLFADGKGVDVQADSLFSGIPVTKAKPASDEIHFYKLNALKEDSLVWKTDRQCIIQVFDSFGVEVYKASGNETLTFDGIRAERNGVYYILLHSVDSYDSQITLDYINNEVSAITKISVANIFVYPNPTNSILYIENAIGSEKKMYDILGNLLIITEENKIDMSSYSGGTYLLYINNKVVKVVKQ